MKLAIQVGSDVVGKSIEQVVKALGGHERVENPDDADVVILSDDTRQMPASLKRGKQVIQFPTQPSMEPATGLQTSYPDQFLACYVVPLKGLPGFEALLVHLATLSGKEKTHEPAEDPRG
jgi:hypothetical protein